MNSTTNVVTFTANSSSALQLNGNSATVGGLIVDPINPGSPVIENANGSAATLTVNQPAGVVTTFPGTIRDGSGGGALALSLGGSGTLNLTGANTFTGGVTLNSGVLGVGSNNALGSASAMLTVSSGTSGGTILALGAARTIANPISGANLTVGGSNNMAFTGAFTATIDANNNTTITDNNTGSTAFSGVLRPPNGANLQINTGAAPDR